MPGAYACHPERGEAEVEGSYFLKSMPLEPSPLSSTHKDHPGMFNGYNTGGRAPVNTENCPRVFIKIAIFGLVISQNLFTNHILPK